MNNVILHSKEYNLHYKGYNLYFFEIPNELYIYNDNTVWGDLLPLFVIDNKLDFYSI